jgi:hypothetical protein
MKSVSFFDVPRTYPGPVRQPCGQAVRLALAAFALACTAHGAAFMEFDAQTEFAALNLVGTPPASDLMTQVLNPFGFSIGLTPGTVSPLVDFAALNAVAFCAGCPDGTYSGTLTVPFHVQLRNSAIPRMVDSSLSFEISDVIGGRGITHLFTVTFPAPFSMDFGDGFVVHATPSSPGFSVSPATGEFLITDLQVTLLLDAPSTAAPDPSSMVLVVPALAVLLLRRRWQESPIILRVLPPGVTLVIPLYWYVPPATAQFLATGGTGTVAGAVTSAKKTPGRGSAARRTPRPAQAGLVNAIGKLELRPCPQRDPVTGASLRVCSAGLRGSSTGQTCLTGITYVNGVQNSEYDAHICTQSCTNSALRMQDPCPETVAPFYNGIAWRTYASLPGLLRASLDKWQTELLELANTETNSREYGKRGGDGRRVELMQKIVSQVLEQMIPLRWKSALAITSAASPEHFVYEKTFCARCEATTASPMGIETDLRLHIYGYGLMRHDKDHYTKRGLDDLAADLIHEMYHFAQEQFGYGEVVQSKFGYNGDVQRALHEIMAYRLAMSTTFYEVVYGDRMEKEFGPGILVAINNFYRAWRSMDTSEKLYIARWAWVKPDAWMRRKMLADSWADGAVWGALCSADPREGPCNLRKTK